MANVQNPPSITVAGLQHILWKVSDSSSDLTVSSEAAKLLADQTTNGVPSIINLVADLDEDGSWLRQGDEDVKHVPRVKSALRNMSLIAGKHV